MSNIDNYYGEHTEDEDTLKEVKPNLKREVPITPPFLQSKQQLPLRDQIRRKTKPSVGDTVLINSMNPNYPEIARRAGNTILDVTLEHSPPIRPVDTTNADHTKDLDKKLVYPTIHHQKSPNVTKALTRTLFPNLPTPQVSLLDSPPLASKAPSEMIKTESISKSNDVFAKPFSPHRDGPLSSTTFPLYERPVIRRPSLHANFAPITPLTPLDKDVNIKQTLQSSPINQFRTNAPSASYELPPLQSPVATSPQSIGSPQITQNLPPVAPLLEIANHSNKSRSRASSTATLMPSQHTTSVTTSVFAPTAEPIGSPQSYQSPKATTFRGPSIVSAISIPNDDFHTSSLNKNLSSEAILNNSNIIPVGTSIRNRSDSMIKSPKQFQRAKTMDVTDRIDNVDNTKTSDQNSLKRSSTLQSLAPSTTTAAFPCPFPKCTAPPFQTQYLLNSHKTVHSSDRPHYCDHPGCKKGPGGQGFKRKNELKRHGLVHVSPGYICPFCSNKTHRYPRPDNLLRHVKKKHPKADPNDEKLRGVLDLKIEAANKTNTRRRRRKSTNSANKQPSQEDVGEAMDTD